MKRKISILPALLVLTACSETTDFPLDSPVMVETENNVGISTAEVLTSDFTMETGTRATLNPTVSPIAFSWTQGDMLALYAGKNAAGEDQTGLTNFGIKRIDESDPSHAIFEANGFNLKGGTTYYGFFPYNPDATQKGRIPVCYGTAKYDGLTQEADNAYGHLGEKDYQYAAATASGNTEAADITLQLKHLGAICRYQISNVPSSIHFSRFSITCDGIITKGTVDLTTTTPVIVAASSNTPILNLTLGEPGTGYSATKAQQNDAAGTLTFYTMMAPANLSGKKMTLRLYSGMSDMHIWEKEIDGKNMAAGKTYGYTASYDTATASETDEWVDLGLTREDGSRILFGKNNLGYTGDNRIGSKPAWTNSDPVPALRGPEWRTPTFRDLHELFCNSSLTWEKTADGLLVINHDMETRDCDGDGSIDGEGAHRLFLPYTATNAARYWSATAVDTYWPAPTQSADGELEKAHVNSWYCAKTVNSTGVITYNSATCSQSLANQLAIRPVFIGEQ